MRGLAVDAHALIKELADLHSQRLVSFGSWGLWLMQPSVVSAAVNFENTAHAGESKFSSVRLDKRVLHPDCLAK